VNDVFMSRQERKLTAEDTETAEKKMASINYLKFGFSEPAPAPNPGISAVRHSA